MVLKRHEHHIILWEKGDAYMHIDPERLTPEFIERIKADKKNVMGWKQHRKVMKEKGYDIE